MRYFAQVIIAFAELANGRNLYAIWESTLVLDAEGPSQALKQAILTSRRVFDDSKNWRALGYFSKPCFYGVRWVDDEADLPGRRVSRANDCMMLRMIGTFDETQMAKLTTFEDVLVPYHVIYID
jgi:hypothetical protein